MSVRNNEDRLGHREPSDSSPVPQAQQAAQSSPFSFVVPTEFVTLPSKGKYYPEGHPLHGVEVIEVSHMTAKEEDILTSKSLLRKGVAIDRLLQSVIVDKRVDPNGLLIGDKNAIIVATRIHAYGEDYETKVTCPACGTTSNYGFDLSQIGFDFEEDLSLFEGVVEQKDSNYVITLPKTKVKVEAKLLTGQDEKNLSEAAAMKRKHNLPESPLTDQFRAMIVSVNGNADPAYINSFIEAVPAKDSRFLRSVYDKIVPNIDMSQQFSCNNCGYDTAMEVPLSAGFFWPGQ